MAIATETPLNLRKQAARDRLEDAVSMLNFLMDVSPMLADGHGLTDDAACGAALIFRHISSTINQARELL